MEQRQPLQQMVWGDLDSYVQKNETRSPTYTIHKNKLKMDKRLNISCNTIKVLEENIPGKSQTFHAATSSQTYPLKQGT